MARNKLVWVLVASAMTVPWVMAQEAGDPEAGQRLFTDFQCWQCHGYEGQGGAAPRIAPTVYPFEAFSQLVRHTNVMPAYSPNVLSEENLRDIYEFVRTRPQPPAVEDIPALSDL